MSQIEKKYIDFGTGSTQVNSRVIPANYTPTNYTPDDIASEGNDKISAHLKGIDTALSGGGGLPAGDINPTSFSGANNQSSAANVTGLVFASSDQFKAWINIKVIATSNLYEAYEILAIKKGASWELVQESNGDDSLVVFSITSGGQIQYTSANYSGFTSLDIKFRAEAL
jgi:hypothetical protein